MEEPVPVPGSEPEPVSKPFCDARRCYTPCGRIPQRIVTALMLHLGLQCAFTIRQVYHVAILEMTAEPSTTNQTVIACPQFPPLVAVQSKHVKLSWTRANQAMTLYAYYIGYMAVQVPGGWISDIYGGRYVLFACLALGAIINAFIPVLTEYGGYKMAAVLRVLLGVVLGPVLPCIASFCSKWFPPSERTFLAGISYAGTNLGNILGNVVTGALIKATGSWHLPFYFWSFTTAIYIVTEWFFLYSFPLTHPYIDKHELHYLKRNIVVKKHIKTPWRDILTNIPFWANVIGQYAHNYIFFTIITYLPTYMRDILRFNIAESGIYSSLPLLSLWLSSLILCCVGEYIVSGSRCLSNLAFNRIFGTLGNYACAFLMLAATYVGCNREWAITLYMIGMSIKAFYYMTLPVNINELSRNYGGVLFGITNGICATSGYIGNLIIGTITKDGTLQQWQTAFWITFIISIVSSVIYCCWSSSDRQDFDYGDEGVSTSSIPP